MSFPRLSRKKFPRRCRLRRRASREDEGDEAKLLLEAIRRCENRGRVGDIVGRGRRRPTALLDFGRLAASAASSRAIKADAAAGSAEAHGDGAANARRSAGDNDDG
jgi:hypothetical protein